MKRKATTFGNSEFSLDWVLNACLVTRDLLSQIERQLALLERDLLGDSSGVKRQYEIGVPDEFGKETFYAASDIPLNGFPETTEAVRIFFEASRAENENTSSDKRSIRARVSFGGKYGNRMTICIRGPLAREKATGFCERIDQMVEPFELETWFFRRRSWLLGICGITAVIAGFVSVVNVYDQLTAVTPRLPAKQFWYWTVAAVTSGAYLAIVEIFYPQCAFETSRWSDRQRWKIWIMEGFATLLLFDTVVVGFWRKALSALGFHAQ